VLRSERPRRGSRGGSSCAKALARLGVDGDRPFAQLETQSTERVLLRLEQLAARMGAFDPPADSAIEEQLAVDTSRLRPRDWKSGERLRVVEVIAPFSAAEEMVKDLKPRSSCNASCGSCRWARRAAR
jgi:hypothetical protein